MKSVMSAGEYQDGRGGSFCLLLLSSLTLMLLPSDDVRSGTLLRRSITVLWRREVHVPC